MSSGVWHSVTARTPATRTPSSSLPASAARSTDWSAACSPWADRRDPRRQAGQRPPVPARAPRALAPAHPGTATETARFKEAKQDMKRLLWIVGFPIFLAACSAPGGLYGSAPAASSTAAAPAASASASTATPAPTPVAPASVIATQNARLGTILANAQGRTLYYFLPERGGKIVCSSSACTNYWPPSLSAGGGIPTRGAGVTGQLSLIARAGGAQQI